MKKMKKNEKNEKNIEKNIEKNYIEKNNILLTSFACIFFAGLFSSHDRSMTS